jgi:FlaG/FlaF family flagellin (archaellin)
MSSKNQRRRSWPKRIRNSHKGVTEIVGTILTVSITVVLFSGIMFFVGTMPQPKGTTTTSFAGETTYNNPDTYVNITQMGGQRLSNSDTRILLTVDGGQQGDYSLNDGGMNGQDWVPGLTWTKKITGIGQYANIQALIYQRSVGDVIWQGAVSDSDAMKMPVIASKGIWDGAYVYNTPIFNGSSVKFYVLFASTQDIQYLDTSSVVMDGSSIGLGAVRLYKDASNQFLYYSNAFYVTSYAWTGQRVSFTFSTTLGTPGPVVYSTLNILPNPSQSGGGNNVNPTPNMWVNAMNGYAIFEYNDWVANSYSATPRTQFTMGQKIVYVVASQSLLNVLIDSSLYHYDRSTGLVIPAASSPNYRFTFHEYTGGYYVFNVTFNSASMPRNNELYPVKLSLMDNSQPTNQAIINTNITIGTPTTNLATLRTYSSAARTTDTLCSTFNITEKVYVRITMPAGAGVWNPSIGTLYVAGYNGIKQINLPVGLAGSNPTNGVVFLERINGNNYDIRVDLNNASQDVWPLGSNKYTIAYNPFTTSTNQFYAGWTIGINSPMYRYDMSVASGPLTSSANGLCSILEFYKGEYRLMRSEGLIPEFEMNKPGGGSYRPPDALITRVGDIDGDMMNEVAVLVNGEGGLDIEVYDYFQSSWWAKIAVLVPYSVSNFVGFELANLDFDSDLDIVYATTSNVYRVINQGTYWSQFTPLTPLDASSKSYSITGLLVANLTTTTGANTAADIVVFANGVGLSTFRYCYMTGSTPATGGPTQYYQVIATLSGGKMTDGTVYTQPTARAKIFILDDKGGISKNGFWNTNTNLMEFNGSAYASGITSGTSIRAGKFVGTNYVDLMVVTKLYVYFIVQSSENSFAAGTGSILTLGGVGNDNGFTSAAVADLNGDGFDDFILSDNLETGNTATGQGVLRIGLNKAGTNGWWQMANGNLVTLGTIFGIINDVSLGLNPVLSPY